MRTGQRGLGVVGRSPTSSMLPALRAGRARRGRRSMASSAATSASLSAGRRARRATGARSARSSLDHRPAAAAGGRLAGSRLVGQRLAQLLLEQRAHVSPTIWARRSSARRRVSSRCPAGRRARGRSLRGCSRAGSAGPGERAARGQAGAGRSAGCRRAGGRRVGGASPLWAAEASPSPQGSCAGHVDVPRFTTMRCIQGPKGRRRSSGRRLHREQKTFLSDVLNGGGVVDHEVDGMIRPAAVRGETGVWRLLQESRCARTSRRSAGPSAGLSRAVPNGARRPDDPHITLQRRPQACTRVTTRRRAA